MKKLGFLLATIALLSLVLCCTLPTTVALADTTMVKAKAAYLVDIDGTVEMYAQNEQKRYPIASMVKVMTALLTLEAIERGEATLDETVQISQEAMGMGGSQMFLNAGDNYPLGDLLKGVIVVSANDACVALAERLAGSENAFVEQMNHRAQELGMNNTHFANCTGLPHPEGYSCAKDVSKMLSKLVRYEDYHKYCSIWLEDYVHPDGRVTTLTNTNKLVRFYEGCDGGKTGFTQEAGFCLAASAHKKGMRVISVVIGCSDSKTRFANSSSLLNYAFANYKFAPLAEPEQPLAEAEVRGGKVRAVQAGTQSPLGVICPVGETPQARVEYTTEPCKAPLTKGDKVGEAHLVVNGVVQNTLPLVALNDVAKATYGDAIQDFLGHYHL